MKWASLVIVLTMVPLAGQHPVPSPPAAKHERVDKMDVPGRRFELKTLSGAVLFASPELDKSKNVPLVIHFHGAAWLVEYQIAKHLSKAALITVQLGAGSSVYNRPFDRTDTFQKLITEAKLLLDLKREWSSVTLTAWSAGYGAVRAILRDDENFARVDGVLLLDGIHASYSPEGKQLGEGGSINTADLDSFLKFARRAEADKKRFVITHSEIFPGSYASTTECTDYLLASLGLKRRLDPHDGPMGMHQLTRADDHGFHIRGYSGTVAADHIDHIHAMSSWLPLLHIR